MDEKGPEQSNNSIVLKHNLNTALKVRRIIDYLINTLDFRNLLEIAISDLLSSIVLVNFESENESKQKIRPVFISDLFAFRWKPITQYKNFKI